MQKQLDELRANLTKAGVPQEFWRYDLPPDPRVAGIMAYNRGVDHWNKKAPQEQERIDRIGTRPLSKNRSPA